MDAWWNGSNYWDIGIYIGGVNRSCSQPYLTPTWVTNVHNDGFWSFGFFWVGLQAPCNTRGLAPMSYDPATATSQGRQAADNAVSAAGNLGFNGLNVYYFDMEGYDTNNVACKTAVNSFVNGWSARLTDFWGEKAGMYGSCSGSSVDSWWFGYQPDQVWVAEANNSPSVWAVCLPASHWVGGHRLHQYTGGHKRDPRRGHAPGRQRLRQRPRHAPRSFHIRGSCVYKLMTGRAVLAGLLLAALVVAGCGTRVAERPGTSEPPAAKVSALQRVGQDGGWLLTDKNLLWEKGNAGSARTITPPGEAASDISAVSFLDPQDGWAATRARRSTNGSEVTVFRTSDGGSTWNSATVAAPPGVSGVASLDFVDASHGFLLANVESSSNFSFGELYGTDDAGATWAKLSAPSGGSMRFVTPSLGFIAGGPLNDKLYVTSDGGNSWRQRSVVLPEAFASAQTVYGVPTFATDRAGVLPVTLLPSGGSPAVAFYSTADGGASWKLAAVRLVSEAPAALGLGVRIPTDVLSLDSWVVAAPNGGRVFSTADGGRRWKEIAPNGLPKGVNDIDFGTLSDGWSVLAYGQCAGSKTDCTLTREARWTADGGQTWDVVRQ